MYNLDLRGNATGFKTLPTRTLASIYIDLYIRDGISQNLSFCMSIFARETLLLFRCFNIHVEMFVLLRYCARK